MDHIDFREIGTLVSEARLSLEYLWKKRGNIVCPHCESPDFYYQQRRRLRCKSGKKEYWPLQGTRFTILGISPSHWLSRIKLFELSTSTRKASQEVHLSYKTTLRSFDIHCRVLVEELVETDYILKGELEADEAYFGGRMRGNHGRGAGGKTLIYGILERGGRVSVSIVEDVSAESLMTGTVKKVRRGSLVYTDKWRGYDSLMFCGHKHHQHRPSL